MALSANTMVKFRGDWVTREFPVYGGSAAGTIYKGSIVMLVSGYLRVAADTSGGIVIGIAAEAVDNSGGTSGDLRCRVLVPDGLGEALMTSSGLAQTDLLATVYVDDDDSVTKSDPGNTVKAGKITEYVSATSVWVAFRHVNDTL